MLFTEAADTTSAAFTDEIQRNARQELDGFNELMKKSVEISREKLDATRVEISHKITAEQEEFLRRFHDSMSAPSRRVCTRLKARSSPALPRCWTPGNQ